MKRWFIFTSWLIALPVFAQQDFSKVEIQAQPLGGTVYMLTGAGGNIGLSVAKLHRDALQKPAAAGALN
jgi:hypothetical protein